MALIHAFSFLVAILVLEPWSEATSDCLAPILSPLFEDVCKETVCGKGTCKASTNTTFGFECACEPGWKQPRREENDDLRFLPCVIPNCTLNLSCGEAPSPSSEREKQFIELIFDPCHWADCGGGTCNRTSVFAHKCDCNKGYFNLLNSTAFPCFKECALGADCSRLGIDILNNSTSSPPSQADNSQNLATPIRTGGFNWLILNLLCLALALCR